VTGAAPVWAEIMSWLHRATPSQAPRSPGGVLSQRIAFPHRVEPERNEWFIRGTEPRGAAQELAHEQAHILAPVDGAILALDPDIPSARQRVVFEAASAQATFRWMLDGVRIGTAAEPFLWEPRPGRHTLTLCDERDNPIDVVQFGVRGLVARRTARR
jgi:penicillin-binding protein 1C